MSAFRCLCAFVLFFPVFGCSEQSAPTASVPKVADSEAAAIKALRDAGAIIKTADGGFATDLDLHQQTLSPDTPKLIAELKSLRVLNLADSSLAAMPSAPSDDLPPGDGSTIKSSPGDLLLDALNNASPKLVSLDLRGCQISDGATTTIDRFTNLRALRFSGKNGKTSLGDEGLRNLAACKSLKVLALDDLWIGTEGLKSLAELKDLEELYLAGTVVDDESARVIAGFPKLKKLRLARTQISDAGLEVLSPCSTLEEIDLSEDSLITNLGMSHLARLTNLRKLNLWRVQISDDGAVLLAPLEKLEWLNLDNTKLSDAGLSVVKNMNALTFLHLGSTQITAVGAPALFHLKALKDLKVTRTALGANDIAIADLKKNLPDTAIQTEYVEKE